MPDGFLTEFKVFLMVAEELNVGMAIVIKGSDKIFIVERECCPEMAIATNHFSLSCLIN